MSGQSIPSKASFLKWLVDNGWYDGYFQKSWITEHGRHIFIPDGPHDSGPMKDVSIDRPERHGDAWHGYIQIGEPAAEGSGEYGYERTEIGKDSMYLGWMNVNEYYQGRGYGRIAYGKIENQLRERGIKTVYLYPKDSEARQFWENMGYKDSQKNMGDIYPGVYAGMRSTAPLMEKDISAPTKREEEDIVHEPRGDFVVPKEHFLAAHLAEKYYGITLEKGIWDFLSHLFQRGDATANAVVYGTAADDVMRDQDYVVWQTAEDEKVCNYCGPLDFKVVSTEEMGGFGYPPVHVNCRCEVSPYSEIYGEEPPTYYHSPKFEYDPNADDILSTSRINLSIVPYFQKIEKKQDASTNTKESKGN